MQKYETLMVLHPDLPEAQTRETLGRARRLIEEQGGQVGQVQEWGLRDLAFLIRKQSRGYYALLEYVAEPAVVRELERTLKITEEVLRFISVAASEVRQKGRAAEDGAEASSEEESEKADTAPSASAE